MFVLCAKIAKTCQYRECGSRIPIHNDLRAYRNSGSLAREDGSGGLRRVIRINVLNITNSHPLANKARLMPFAKVRVQLVVPIETFSAERTEGMN